MQILKSTKELIEKRKEWQRSGVSVGFVPTMGALHLGHLSLVRLSLKDNDKTLVSLFVNPTQFNDPKDFKNYPITLEDDLKMLEDCGVDFVFIPSPAEMYEDKYRYQIVEQEFSLDLCGKDRPGHFTGVLTVVMKLLNLALASKAYFGEKDFQQYKLIEGMLKSFFHPTQMIMGETIREEDGLAMSSRNRLLSMENRSKAAKFNQILRTASTCEEAKAQLESDGFVVDYVKELSGDFAGRRFAAVRLGGVRLIDNVRL